MNYLKTVLLTLICLIFIKLVSAQKFYVGISSGYAIGIANQRGDMVNSYVDYSKVVTEYRFENVPYSLGRGWNIGGQFGYRFHKNIAFETQINYHQSADVDQNDIEITSNFGIGKSELHERKTISAKMYRITPSIVLHMGNEKINPYMKLGAVIGFGRIITDGASVFNSVGNTNSSSYKKIDEGGVSFGAKGAFGLDYILSSKWSVFSELSFITMSYAPEYGNLETSDGTKRNYNYDDSFSESEKFIILFDMPETLKRSYNFNSCGLDLGVRFSF
ncbi:outer membrane beta-barrel protein [bacterium SCSIO 12643]|nr:outer membrane beta-barrel protein [bacterium SCSIO 12643]